MNLIKVIDILIYCFFGFLSLYTCHLFLSITLGYEKNKKVSLLIAYIIYFIIMALMNITVASPILNFVSSLVGLMFISLLYNSNLFSKLIYSITFTIVLSLTETVFGSIFSMVTGNKMDTILNNINMVFFLYSTSNFVPFIFLKIYSIKNEKTNYEIKSMLPKDVLIQLFAVPIISIITQMIIIVTINNDFYFLSVIITVSIILINIVFFNLIEKTNQMAQQQIDNNILNSQIEYYNALYENINNERNETLKLKHNVKNSFIRIKTLLIENEIEKALIELDNELGFKFYTNEIFSDIPIIDAIFNYKNKIAKDNNIKLNSQISIRKDVNLNDSDFVNILGNGLDNAIEACIKNADVEKKNINCSIQQKYNSIYINISNPYEEKIALKDNLPLSSKRHNKHGIGLKTIEKIANENDYIMNINMENNIFELEIIIFTMSK